MQSRHRVTTWGLGASRYGARVHNQEKMTLQSEPFHASSYLGEQTNLWSQEKRAPFSRQCHQL